MRRSTVLSLPLQFVFPGLAISLSDLISEEPFLSLAPLVLIKIFTQRHLVDFLGNSSGKTNQIL